MQLCGGLRFLVFSVVFLFFVFGQANAKTNNADEYQFVINLASSTQPISAPKLKSAKLQQSYYYKIRLESKYQYRLRLGFFKTRKEAQTYLNLAKNQFPGAWLDSIKTTERQLVNKWLKRKSNKVVDIVALTALMEKAREAIVAKKYKKAIRLYTKVIQSGKNPYQKEAQEYLGLSRERNGQLAHAKAEYTIYLEKYPKGDDAERVKQRLDALVTAYKKPGKGLAKFEPMIRPKKWQNFGALLQFYDRDVIDTEQAGEIVASSILSTNVNYTSRLLNSDYKIKTYFSGNHIYDFENSEDDDSRLNSMYVDMINPGSKLHTRFGRQKGRSGGVVGRFDGLDFSYRLNGKYKLKLISGFPVELSKTVEDHTDKHFISLGLDYGPFRKHWDANVFVLQQQADGIVDRSEIGGEVRYRSKNTSLFSMLDYSIGFSEINYFMTIYNRRFKDQSTIDVIMDYRKSPFLTTTSALQGQVGVSTLGDLLDTLTEDEIEQLSKDRTSLYKSLTVLHSRKLVKNLEFNADVSMSNLSGTTASGGVDALEGTGNEYSASVGLIGTEWLTQNDVNILNYRMSKLATSDVMVLTGSAKYRLSKEWRINPRLRYETRDYDDGRDITKLKPSMRLNYRRSRNWQFEFQLDLEDRETKTPGVAVENESSYFIHVGYIHIF